MDRTSRTATTRVPVRAMVNPLYLLVKSSMPDELDLLSYAHEVATGFYALDLAIEELAEGVLRNAVALQPSEATYLSDNVDVLRRQIAAQMYEAMNFLYHVAPQFARTMHSSQWRMANPIELLRPMLKAYEAKMQKRRIELRLELPRGTPMPSLRIEELMIRRALHNVLTNALKYSYQGSEQSKRFIRIWVSWVFNNQRWWAIHFQNYGLGVKEQEHDLVFLPGYRGELARADGTIGSGLGLAEVRKCMKSHSGDAILESRKVPGETYVTTVSLMFPLAHGEGN